VLLFSGTRSLKLPSQKTLEVEEDE
jgi:hypothetical protein